MEKVKRKRLLDRCLYFVFRYHKGGKMDLPIHNSRVPHFVVVVVVDVADLVAAVAALGSRLSVVRVCLGEDHLGCFQLTQLGRSSHLACSRPI